MKDSGENKVLRFGLDVGSTTAKIVLLGNDDELLMSDYRRHNADVHGVLEQALQEIEKRFGNVCLSASITGSVGMGISEKLSIPFVQEVVAATTFVKTFHPSTHCMIDIGGEDAKIVYLDGKDVTDFRMNGNCAGGTGAFIDQMAVLLGVQTTELDALAAQSHQIYPMASRCGVFSKTDIQNLISRNVCKEDIAASIFHAVAVQTIVTLSHGCQITPPILLCGGPLSFIPSLRAAFADYLHLTEKDFILPEHGELIPAYGTALSADAEHGVRVSDFRAQAAEALSHTTLTASSSLPRLFADEGELERWVAGKLDNNIRRCDVMPEEVYLGIDSGSTTTKIVAVDAEGSVAFEFYENNCGNPVKAVCKGLSQWLEECKAAGKNVVVKGSCSTGYGEDLIKAAFKLDNGVIETIAHYLAAAHIRPGVTFILDIGGQDMKAIFVNKGVVTRMELNEACSSGCGSFIETFAGTLGCPVEKFAEQACLAEHPSDLGTRCTVFMNSKVKQVLREGASIADIAAGLAYSVVKNCLYKVLKLHHTAVLGDAIVVQGGTMKNNAVVRAFEKLTGTHVYRSERPELMGAYGCALYAIKSDCKHDVPLEKLVEASDYGRKTIRCGGCENHCLVQQYKFENGNIFFSGNKCERIFTNRGAECKTGANVYTDKYKMIFDAGQQPSAEKTAARRIGIARCLNMYEEYPFWHTLLATAGFEVVLSERSTYARYEAGVHAVMSDNICFPAKLVHSHINDLLQKGVERIFMPYVIFEKPTGGNTVNSYNCPIVTGYSDVVRSVTDTDVPIDSPVISFKEKSGLQKECRDYLMTLGVERKTADAAFEAAWQAMDAYEQGIGRLNEEIFKKSHAAGELTIVLVGRPYHTDPLIQHKLSDMIAALGVNVISDDIVRGECDVVADETFLVQQWAYVNRILRAAAWTAKQDDTVHLVQMTSFGCGPDAFLTDEVRDILGRKGKPYTLLKVDDVNNIGSLKLRVRSLVESLKLKKGKEQEHVEMPFLQTKAFTETDRKRKILVPYFTDFISPLIPDIFSLLGYEMETLPLSDEVSAEDGLRFANNEVCYPATLIVGDLIKALSSGRYDLGSTAVAITQTGGQCRATNYVALIKKALVDTGFAEVPVITIGLGGQLLNEQPGFRLSWRKILPVTLAAILFSDCMAKFYYATLAREAVSGTAKRLLDEYMEKARQLIRRKQVGGLYNLIAEAAVAFNGALSAEDRRLPRVGVVGEIFLKFNSFAHRKVVDYLSGHGVEIVPPLLSGFFLQNFVNRKERRLTYVENSKMPLFVIDLIYKLVTSCIRKANRKAAAFRYYVPFGDIFKEAEHARGIVSLSAQFGEGWELPAEIVSFIRSGVNNVVSLQPFGCIANQVISKGVEKKIKQLYPQSNLLSLDFDGGVSDVNVRNRVLLFMDNLK